MSMNKEHEVHTCVICGEEFIGWGNDAWPLADGDCCDSCNEQVVDARLERVLGIGQKQAKEA